MPHAYLTTGDIEQGIARSKSFAETELHLESDNITVLRYTNFTIDDVRDVIDASSRSSASGDSRALILSAARLFHEAQNAMLKLFEEPQEGMTLFLVVPSEGVVLPTLRSRLTPLPGQMGTTSGRAAAFLELSAADRKKALDKIYDRSKSEKQAEKREARREALELVQDLVRVLHEDEGFTNRGVLTDLSFFVKTLHEVSAPLKPIFEHLLIVLPASKPLLKP